MSINSHHRLAFQQDFHDRLGDIDRGGLSSLTYLRIASGFVASGERAQTARRGRRKSPELSHSGSHRDALLSHQDRHSDEANAEQIEAGIMMPAGRSPTHQRAKEMSSI